MQNNNHEKNPAREQGLVVAEGTHLPSTEYREAIPESQEDVHLRDYLEVIFRRKWLIISFMALVFVSTAFSTLTAEKIYRAKTTIEITPESPKVTKFEELVATQLHSQEFYQTQLHLLQSGTLAKRVIAKLNFAENPLVAEVLHRNDRGASVLSKIKGAVAWLLPKKEGQDQTGQPVPEEVLKQRGFVGFIKGNLSVSPQRNSMLINVAFTSPDRRLSQLVVNTVAGEFVEWDMVKKLEASQLARSFLMKQIDRAKIDLEKAEEDLNHFARQSGIVSLDSKLNSVYRQLEELNSALAEAEADLIGKKAVYDQAVNDGAASLPQVLNNNMISTLKAEYARLRSEYEDQTVIFDDEYPALKALKTRMNSLANRISDEETKVFLAIKGQYEAALKKAGALKDRADQQKQLALELNERATQYKIIDRQVQTNKAIYQSLLERGKEIESMVGISASNIHIVGPAALPLFPYKPKVLRNLLLAIVVGLLGGIGIAFLMEYFADTITNPEEIPERFHIPILGVTPLAKADAYMIEKTFVSDPRAAMSEAVRTTKVSIQLSRADTHAKSFLVTSAGQGDGKTTLVANLAMAFAQAGEKVMIIDADLRRPRIHKLFATNGREKRSGLSSLLAGITDGDPVHQTDIPNLWFIPAGPIPPNPVELLASNRFSKLVSSLEKHFDRIILDSPPNQGFADVLVLSRKVGGVLLVTCLGETTREAVRHFKKSILNVNGNILGCILNKVNFTNRYGYRSYYYHKYYKHYYNYDYGNGKNRKKRQLTQPA